VEIRGLVERGTVLPADDFYAGVLAQIVRDFGVVVGTPSVYRFKSVNPFGPAQALSVIGLYPGAGGASLAVQVVGNGLTEFPVEGAEDGDDRMDSELLRERGVAVSVPVYVSEERQDVLFRKFVSPPAYHECVIPGVSGMGAFRRPI
jgi:hypothetical protein